MEEVFVYVEEFPFQTSYDVSRCRICHEEEFESPLQLEAPCSCSGTIKVKRKKNPPQIIFLNPSISSPLIFVLNYFWVLFFSLLIEIVFRDGAAKKAARFVKFVSRFDFLNCFLFKFLFLMFEFLGLIISTKYEVGFRRF